MSPWPDEENALTARTGGYRSGGGLRGAGEELSSSHKIKPLESGVELVKSRLLKRKED